MTRKRKPRPRGRRYKYSEKQMWYFASLSSSKKKQNKWINRLYKQQIRKARKQGNEKRASYLEGAYKRAREYYKDHQVKRQTWSVASKKDILDFVNGNVLPNEEQGKLLLVDDNGNAVKIAYEGTELYDEIMKHLGDKAKG